MDTFEQAIKRYKADIQELQEQLRPLESGEMYIGERRYGGQWEDVTAKHIESIRHSIKSYEQAIAILGKRSNNA